MLKKVMIICLIFSFVFIGGIGIVLACDPVIDASGGPVPGFISHDSSIIIAAQTQKGHKHKHKPGPKSGHDKRRGPAPNSGDGISDGPGW